VDEGPFPAAALACLPPCSNDEWFVPPEELAVRRDLRQLRICSIDPPTARDLDDALHCVELPDGNFEVGVHIADVSHFIDPGARHYNRAVIYGESV
jgi:exoribonuclease R